MSNRKNYRGNRTHGRGRKAGRGAGKVGGRGNAGNVFAFPRGTAATIDIDIDIDVSYPATRAGWTTD